MNTPQFQLFAVEIIFESRHNLSSSPLTDVKEFRGRKIEQTYQGRYVDWRGYLSRIFMSILRFEDHVSRILNVTNEDIFSKRTMKSSEKHMTTSRNAMRFLSTTVFHPRAVCSAVVAFLLSVAQLVEAVCVRRVVCVLVSVSFFISISVRAHLPYPNLALLAWPNIRPTCCAAFTTTAKVSSRHY